MSPDVQLIALIGGLHLVGILFAALLIQQCLRADTVTPWRSPEDGSDWGGSDRRRPRAPTGPRDGGLPLPDARPARVRLREPGRLADLRPGRERRPAREPGQPRRVPSRS